MIARLRRFLFPPELPTPPLTELDEARLLLFLGVMSAGAFLVHLLYGVGWLLFDGVGHVGWYGPCLVAC